MQQSCTYGSVRGASGNRRPYRDKTSVAVLLCAAKSGIPLILRVKLIEYRRVWRGEDVQNRL
jgi:hypothetical protein